MTMADWWDLVNKDFLLYLNYYLRHGTDRELDEEYRIALGHSPQIRSVVEKYRHNHIQDIPAMGRQVWDELGHGDQNTRDTALNLCIQYMIDNSMRAARARPDRPRVSTSEPDAPSAGPTGGKFNTYRLRIR